MNVCKENMDIDKLSYRRVRNDLHKYLNNKEAAVLLALVFHADYQTGESHVIHRTLVEKTGIPESSLKRYLKQLKEKGIISMTSYYNGVTPKGMPRHLTDYFIQIPDVYYIMVSRKLFDFKLEGVELKEMSFIRGFILLLKCLCMNFTDTTLYSYRKLEEHMQLSYATIAKLMQQCQKYGLVTQNEEGQGYSIMKGLFYNGFPPMTIPKNAKNADRYKDIYKVIYEFCKSKRVVCPPFDSRLLSRIFISGKTPDMLKQLYEKRIQEVPEKISSLNYFVKIAVGKALEAEQEKEKISIVLD